MKLLLIPLLISLVGCGSTITVNDRHQINNSSVAIAANLSRDWYYRLPEKSWQDHQRCIHFALREMQAGEECKWHENNAIGIVKVAKIDSNGCHYLLNTVYYKNKPKYFQENYCYNSSTRKWFKINT